MIDIPSFLIGCGSCFLGTLLWSVFSKPAKPAVLHERIRSAGSRKEDVGVSVDQRAKRQLHTDGKIHYREEKWLERGK